MTEPGAVAGGPGPTPVERAYDEFLEAALRGETPDVEAFCARHGDAGGELRALLDGLVAMLPGGSPPEAVARRPLEPEEGLPVPRLGDFRLIRTYIPQIGAAFSPSFTRPAFRRRRPMRGRRGA